MKKRLCLLLLLTLCLAAASAAGEDAAGWVLGLDQAEDLAAFVNSGTCTLTVDGTVCQAGSGALKVSGRTVNNWDAADLKAGFTPIEAGKPFTLKAWMYVDSDKDGQVAIGKASGDYAYLAMAGVKGRTWTQLTVETTLDSLCNLRFLTASDNYTGVDFYVDQIEITVAQEAAAEEEDSFAAYTSDFSAGTDGWYARSNGGAQVSVTGDGALRITGRSDDWNSPGRDFVFTPGKDYAIRVLVRQDEAASANFIVSIAHSLNGTESYENLGTCKAARGEWVELEGSYTAGRFDTYVLYVETMGSPALSFDIKEFSVARNEIDFGGEGIPSLKEVYADAFDFGNAVTKSEADSPDRMNFYATQFAIMTPGNEMKPDFLIDLPASRAAADKDDTAVVVKFDAIRPLLDFARDHGIKVHGHVFVWHSQTPEAFFHEGYIPSNPYVSREVMLARLENFMRGVFDYLEEYYPGVVVSYDVVNEAIDDGTGCLRASNWLTVVGDDYINRAFEIARRTAPEGVRLFYNDYNTAYEPKLSGIRSLLENLMQEGNIDGYGFQMHHALNSPTLTQIRHAVETIAETGLRLRVSELDITIPAYTEQNLRRQADMYAGIMEILLEHAEQFDAVQVWGTTDDLSWRASGYPLLFDGKSRPKYAFWALTDPEQIPTTAKHTTSFGPLPEGSWDAAAVLTGDRFTVRSFFTEEGNLMVRVTVKDETVESSDIIEVFVGERHKIIRREMSVAREVEGGWEADFTMKVKCSLGDTLSFDVMIVDGTDILAWNDQSDAVAGRFLGEMSLEPAVPLAFAPYGAEAYSDAFAIPVDQGGSADADEGGTVKATGWASWDGEKLYVRVSVTDAYLDVRAANSYEQDSVEVFLDEKNDRGSVYGTDDHHYRVNCDGVMTVDAGVAGAEAGAVRTEDGYDTWFVIPLTQVEGDTVGFDIRVNNAGADGRRRLLNFCDATDRGWSNPSLFGQLRLLPEGE